MISAVVLAAGASRRMGRPKPLVKLRGRTILQHVVANLRASQVDEIVVVLGYRAEEILPTLEGEGCRVVVNPDYDQGMSSSLRQGLGAVHHQAQAVLIILGDQPYISSGIIDLLLGEYDQGRHEIVVPTCGGQRGHPVIFSRKYWPELLSLEGDVGGREILHRHGSEVWPVEVGDPGILRDIDRPGDGRDAAT
jgi:molybdenum cofactor cytidylyltransferase